MLIFGNASSAKRITLGTSSTGIQYKYKAPPASGETGYLYIYTSTSIILDTIIFSFCTYGTELGIISNSDSTEFNSGSNF